MYNEVGGVGIRVCISTIVTRLSDSLIVVDAPELLEITSIITRGFLVKKNTQILARAMRLIVGGRSILSCGNKVAQGVTSYPTGVYPPRS